VSKKPIAIFGNLTNTAQRQDYIVVTWRLLLRCNYDCSYCVPELHNLTDDIPSIDRLKAGAVTLNEHARTINKKIIYVLSGGEPFLIKNLPCFLKFLQNLSETIKISLTTNSSAPFKIYEKTLGYVDQIVFSIHFEQYHDSIKLKIKNIISLNRLYQNKIIVTVMLEKSFLDEAEELKNILKENSVRFYFKLVVPQLTSDLITFNPVGASGGLISPASKEYTIDNYPQVLTDFYNDEEKTIIKSLVSDENVSDTVRCLWDDKTVSSVSISFLMTDLNSFKGWLCYAGLLQVEIMHDGSMYVGLCKANGMFGNLYDVDSINWPQTAIICPKNACTCSTDLSVPKQKISTYAAD
jgi:MoaA/NifB/PqqE/SkfB family radical SAM enzyme